MANSRYIDAADAAKLIRKAIAREFPGVTFSVTTDKYSGGATVNIKWVDGPTTKQVEAVTNAYRGRGFDGMIDLAYCKDSWLLPDGTVKAATSQGSSGSGGMDKPYSLPKPHPKAELVHFGSSYVSCSREHSPEFVRWVAEQMQTKTGWTAPEIKEHDAYWSRNKTVPTAYFERGYTADADTVEREYTHALYSTPEGGPLVTRFDYAFEGDEESEPEIDAAGLAAENARIHAAEIEDITRNRATSDAAELAQAAQAAEPEQPKADPADVQSLILAELRELAKEITSSSPSEFVKRCVLRKIAAVNDSTELAELIKVGDDLVLMAQA